MAYTDAQMRYGEYVIGYVESRHDYGATNQYDAITLGIVQWWGGNAARLLSKVRAGAPAEYARLSQRLRDAMDAHEGDFDWWGESYYLDPTDAESWRAIGSTPTVKAIQDAYYLEWASAAIDVLLSWGIGEQPVQVMLMYMSAYWQNPYYTSQVVATCGNQGLAAVRDAILAHRVFGQYASRYTAVYNMLATWDGTSAPPDFGQVSTSNLPTDPSAQVQANTLNTTVGYLELVGNDIILHGKTQAFSNMICRYTGNNVWIPIGSTVSANPGAGGTPTTSVPTGGSANEPEDFKRFRALWEAHWEQFGYTQGSGRLNPLVSGATDCSAAIWWGQHVACDGKYDWIGTDGYAQDANCPKVFEHRGSGARLPIEDMRPGDIISIDYAGGGGHVTMYWGNNTSVGCGSAPCPKVENTDVRNGYSAEARPDLVNIAVLRFFE